MNRCPVLATAILAQRIRKLLAIEQIGHANSPKLSTSGVFLSVPKLEIGHGCHVAIRKLAIRRCECQVLMFILKFILFTCFMCQRCLLWYQNSMGCNHTKNMPTLALHCFLRISEVVILSVSMSCTESSALKPSTGILRQAWSLKKRKQAKLFRLGQDPWLHLPCWCCGSQD